MSRASRAVKACRIYTSLNCLGAAASVSTLIVGRVAASVIVIVTESIAASLLVLACASLPTLFVSGLVMNLAHAESSEDAIRGHRLFFTEAQRKQATEQVSEQSSRKLSDAVAGDETAGKEGLSIAGGDADKSLKAPSPGPPVSRQVQASLVNPEGTVDNYQVYYSGLVVGLRGAGVLVNGLPCQFESGAWKRAESTPLSLDCSGVKNEDLVLTLLRGSGVLTVSDAGGRVHRLVPGEQW